MMPGPGTFFALEASRRGLMAHQKSLEVTGHNITNANTPGYSRQQAVHKTGLPYSAPGMNAGTGPGQLGSGVEIAEIRRICNEYLDDQAREISAGMGYWSSQYDVAKQVELIVPEPDGRGLQDVLINFFNDWHKLNNLPEDPGVRTAVLETAEELCNQFRQMFNQLEIVNTAVAAFAADGIYEERLTSGMLADQVQQANNIVTEIVELNRAISLVIKNGRQPNDLLDKRDLLLETLAGYGELEITPAAQEVLSIKMHGVMVIDGSNTQHKMTVVLEKGVKEDGGDAIIIKNKLGDSFKLDGDQGSPVEYGSLAGLVAARNQILEHVQSLNKLARVLADEVNGAHCTDEEGGGNDNKGIFSFGSSDPESPDYQKDPENPAQSLVVNVTINEIDSERALAIARLRSTNIEELDDMTFESKYGELVSIIGTGCKISENRYLNREAAQDQINIIRQSASGISLDEELTLMIQFQYGFQACSRMIYVIDDMLDVIINRLF